MSARIQRMVENGRNLKKGNFLPEEVYENAKNVRCFKDKSPSYSFEYKGKRCFLENDTTVTPCFKHGMKFTKTKEQLFD